MRQLDLFGSLFDTPSQEDKPDESVVAVKKEDENKISPRTSIATAYSKNTLRSERASVNTSAKDPSPSSVEKMEVTEDNLILSATEGPAIITLFDAPGYKVIPETLSNLTAENRIEQEQTFVAVKAVEKIQDVEQKPVAEVNENAVIDQPEIIILEKGVVTPPLQKESTEITAVAFQTVPAKQKKQKLPELERTGSIIFDDGKISVKIKNKSPFPAPITKAKKEKVKKLPQKRGRKSFKEIDAEVDLIEIPEDEILFQKQYYAISEVAKWFRVNTSLLRFWENEFDVLKPRKNRKGDRLFRPEDVKNLQLIYQLLRQRKYTIEGAKEYIKTNKKKADIQLQLTNTLQKFKSFLLDMKANLQ